MTEEILGKDHVDKFLKIRVDTREQKPLLFNEKYCKCNRGTVNVFDYCLDGDDGFAIERKSLPDFIQAVVLSKSWIREMNKITKAREWGLPVIYILECNFVDISDYDFSIFTSGNVTSQLVYRRVAQLIYEYNVHVFFAGNRQLAAHAICLILKRRIDTIRPAKGQTQCENDCQTPVIP